MFCKFIIFALVVLSRVYSQIVTDVSSKTLPPTNGDFLAAFGDFNGDRRTDIFVITNEGSGIDVLLGRTTEKEMFVRVHLLSEQNVTSVVPGDFDGDLQLDILLTTVEPNNQVAVKIYWGDIDKVNVTTPPMLLNETFPDEPFVFDGDNDMIVDVLTKSGDHSPVLWRFVNRTVTKEMVNYGHSEWKQPHSHALADWDGDLVADLILTVSGGIEIWRKKKDLSGYETFLNVTYPDLSEQLGQLTCVDFDRDGKMDFLLPTCKDKECQQSQIYWYSHDKQEWLLQSNNTFIDTADTWGFVPPSENPAKSIANQQLPIALRIGDFNMDGYPDVLTLLRNNGNSKKSPFLMYNEPSANSRQLQTQWNNQFSSDSQALLPTFFDLYEDGLQDILVVTIATSNSVQQSYIRALKNIAAADACFIKVTIVSSRCFNHHSCPGSRDPYGLNLPGPTLKYSTTQTSGHSQNGVGTQLSQSAHFSLQLPYYLFGLGQTPNFLNSLTVGVPQWATSAEFTQVIPNSQLVVIPNPLQDPSSWKLQLYITPSEAVYFTGAALAGTCTVVALIVGFLHWREKVEDRKEKEQQSQQFHFDAM